MLLPIGGVETPTQLTLGDARPASLPPPPRPPGLPTTLYSPVPTETCVRLGPGGKCCPPEIEGISVMGELTAEVEGIPVMGELTAEPNPSAGARLGGAVDQVKDNHVPMLQEKIS